MVDEKELKSDTGFTRIKPVSIKLTQNSSSDDSTGSKKQPIQRILIIIGFGVLLTSAAIVILFLPNWIKTPVIGPAEISSTSKSNLSQTPSSMARTKTGVSPWGKAQQSKFRRETQNILSAMLDTQKVLDEHGVTHWAEEEYTLAMQHANTGDALYNTGDFSPAKQEYSEALDKLLKLVDRIDEVFEESMEKANKALSDGDSKAAMDAFMIALAIDPIDRSAYVGKQQAESLDEVIALIKKGGNQLDKNQLNVAKATFEQALNLDNESSKAKEKLQLVNGKILDLKFNNLMSSGFDALGTGKLDKAKASFNQALKLKPKSTEAHSALNQTNHNITTIRINTLLAQARKYEQVEKWHDALAEYNSALQLDATLADGQAGRDRTTTRSKIHDRLVQILANPQRLYQQDVYDDTLAFHKKLTEVSNPGNVLTRQLIDLTKLFSRAITPVLITLVSDNTTAVRIRKIGEFGNFLTKEVSLRPGRYVAIGQRDGYRDVRVEFKVDPDSPGQSINIQSMEKIVLRK